MGIKTKPVVEIDKQGKFLNYYASVTQAAEMTGYHSGAISQVCNGYLKHHKGKHWRFANSTEIKLYDRLMEKLDDLGVNKSKPLEPLTSIELPDLPVGNIGSDQAPVLGPGPSNFEKMLKRNK